MNIKESCADLLRHHGVSKLDDKDSQMAYRKVHQLKHHVVNEGVTYDELQLLLETAKKVAATVKANKQLIEKHFMELFTYYPHVRWEEEGETEEREKMARGGNSEDGRIADALVDFAQEMHGLTIDRDAFAGKRRGYALQILAGVAEYFPVPEFMDVCGKSLRNRGKSEFIDSCIALQEYCQAVGEAPPAELIEIVDKRIEKTKNRSEAVSGLNLQVEIGLIDEEDALDRLGEWKGRNTK